MSWEPQACVVAGYKIPREAGAYAMKLIEDDYDTNGRYEDFIVDPDSIRGAGDIFFGKIIFELEEDCDPVRFDSILFSQKDCDEVNRGFNLLLAKWCAEHNYSVRFDKWIMVRWI